MSNISFAEMSASSARETLGITTQPDYHFYYEWAFVAALMPFHTYVPNCACILLPPTKYTITSVKSCFNSYYTSDFFSFSLLAITKNHAFSPASVFSDKTLVSHNFRFSYFYSQHEIEITQCIFA